MMPVNIKKYKISTFLKSNKSLVYGVDVVTIEGEQYHCMTGRKPILFELKADAKRHVKNLNSISNKEPQ